jgi:hypothetical protein
MKPLIAHCPYCFGKQPEVTVNLLGFQVTCPTCLATGPSKTSQKDAKSSWNMISQELERSRHWYAKFFTSELNAIKASFFAKEEQDLHS